jgi:uncharacterized protein (TIGR02996 family)
MADIEPFIRAILDRPDDNAPRLVLADYLEEQGSAQGEYIRLQCERAGLGPGDPRREALFAREYELLRAHRADWLRPMLELLEPTRRYPGRVVQNVEFRRGLVESIRIGAEAFAVHGPRLMAMAPARELCLVSDGPTSALLVELARLNCWSHVEVLNLRWRQWTAAVVRNYLAAAAMPRLRELGLHGPSVGPGVVRALFDWPGFGRLCVRVRDPNDPARVLIAESPHRGNFA